MSKEGLFCSTYPRDYAEKRLGKASHMRTVLSFGFAVLSVKKFLQVLQTKGTAAPHFFSRLSIDTTVDGSEKAW